MSINQLTYPNKLNLYCNTITNSYGLLPSISSQNVTSGLYLLNAGVYNPIAGQTITYVYTKVYAESVGGIVNLMFPQILNIGTIPYQTSVYIPLPPELHLYSDNATSLARFGTTLLKITNGTQYDLLGIITIDPTINVIDGTKGAIVISKCTITTKTVAGVANTIVNDNAPFVVDDAVDFVDGFSLTYRFVPS